MFLMPDHKAGRSREQGEANMKIMLRIVGGLFVLRGISIIIFPAFPAKHVFPALMYVFFYIVMGSLFLFRGNEHERAGE